MTSLISLYILCKKHLMTGTGGWLVHLLEIGKCKLVLINGLYSLVNCWLGRAWATPILAGLHCKTRVYVCLRVAIYRKFQLSKRIPKDTLHFKFAHMLVNGYWQSGTLVTWSWEDWSSSTHGNLLLVLFNGRLSTGSTVQSRRWSRSFQVRAMHKRHL